MRTPLNVTHRHRFLAWVLFVLLWGAFLAWLIINAVSIWRTRGTPPIDWEERLEWGTMPWMFICPTAGYQIAFKYAAITGGAGFGRTELASAIPVKLVNVSKSPYSRRLAVDVCVLFELATLTPDFSAGQYSSNWLGAQVWFEDITSNMSPVGFSGGTQTVRLMTSAVGWNVHESNAVNEVAENFYFDPAPAKDVMRDQFFIFKQIYEPIGAPAYTRFRFEWAGRMPFERQQQNSLVRRSDNTPAVLPLGPSPGNTIISPSMISNSSDLGHLKSIEFHVTVHKPTVTHYRELTILERLLAIIASSGGLVTIIAAMFSLVFVQQNLTLTQEIDTLTLRGHEKEAGDHLLLADEASDANSTDDLAEECP